MTTTTYTNYAEMLNSLRDLAVKAAGVEGADDVGAFTPIRAALFGEFSSLSEFLDDFGDALQDFLAEDGEELEGWAATRPPPTAPTVTAPRACTVKTTALWPASTATGTRMIRRLTPSH